MAGQTGGALGRIGRIVLAGGLLALAWDHAHAAEESASQANQDMKNLPWQVGPFKGAVGDKATVAVPDGARFLSQGKTDRFFELTGNLPRPGASVLVGQGWFAVFGFSDSGYVKDDEKLDADAILKSMKDSDGPANEQRSKRGLPKIYTDDWIVPPHYDPQTKHLEWGVKLREENQSAEGVNYTVRLLGRTGYESVILVTSPDRLDSSVQQLRGVLKDFDFNSGERYEEFKPGDKVAEYGLGALIVGGAAAAAVKTGFWKVIVAGIAAGWKFIVAGVVAIGAGISKFLKRKTG